MKMVVFVAASAARNNQLFARHLSTKDPDDSASTETQDGCYLFYTIGSTPYEIRRFPLFGGNPKE